jgi:hypothetical protein
MAGGMPSVERYVSLITSSEGPFWGTADMASGGRDYKPAGWGRSGLIRSACVFSFLRILPQHDTKYNQHEKHTKDRETKQQLWHRRP